MTSNMQTSQWTRFVSLLRRRWLIMVIVCAVGAVLVTLIVPFIPVYKGQAQLLIVSEALKDTTASDPDLPSIIGSTQVLDRVIARLSLHTDPIDLAKKIKTKMPLKSSIIQITYKDTNQQRAVAVTNAVADESAAFFHQIATHGYAQVVTALNADIARSRRKIAEADRKLSTASADSGFESSDKALDDLSLQLNDLIASRGQIAATLAADRATAASLHKQLVNIKSVVRGEILQKDVAYRQVEAEYAKSLSDLVSERASYRDSFPGLPGLRERVASEQAQKQIVALNAVDNGAGESPSYTETLLDSDRADGAVDADVERLRATDDQIVALQQHLRDVAGIGAHVGTLHAERDAMVQQYVTLTQRLSAAQGDAAQAASLGSLVVVSRAVPGKSSLPLWLAVFALAVLLIAMLVAWMVDRFDRRFYSIFEIERAYGRPVFLEVGAKS